MSAPRVSTSPSANTFRVDELPRLAPWVAEQIASAGLDNVRAVMQGTGQNPDEPQLMVSWVAALQKLTKRLAS